MRTRTAASPPGVKGSRGPIAGTSHCGDSSSAAVVLRYGTEWMLTCLGFWRDIRAALGRALIAGCLTQHTRATPLPRTAKHPTTSSQVSLPCLLVGRWGDAELLHLRTIPEDPFKTDLGRARRIQTCYPLMARKHCKVSRLPSLQLLWVSPNNPQQHRKSHQQCREKSLCKGGKKLHECI